MRVLGIDPGYGRMGVAVLERMDDKKGGEILLFSDCLETEAKQEFAERLGKLRRALLVLIKKWRPNMVALEKLFFTTNQKTAMQVAEVRGMIIALTQEKRLTLCEYTPLQIKIAVTGYGRASKTQVANMLHKLIKIEGGHKSNNKISDDEYDAIAIALTCLATIK